MGSSKYSLSYLYKSLKHSKKITMGYYVAIKRHLYMLWVGEA